MKQPQYKVFVLGIGNILCADDGVGISVVQTLRQKQWSSEVFILEGGTSAINFLEELGKAKHVIVVDAVRGGEKTGTIHRYTEEDLAAFRESRLDSHGFSLLWLVELARAMTGYPVNVIVYGVEIHQLHFGAEVSPRVLQAIPAAAEKVEQEIIRICSEQTKP